MSMVSMPAFAGVADTGQTYQVPEFSVIIGSAVFEMNWANDTKNETVIKDAVINNTKGVYVQTFKGTWFENSTGKEVGRTELQGLEATSFNAIGPDKDIIAMNYTLDGRSIDGELFKTCLVGEDFVLDTSTVGLHKITFECIDSLGKSKGVREYNYEVMEAETQLDETTLDYTLNY